MDIHVDPRLQSGSSAGVATGSSTKPSLPVSQSKPTTAATATTTTHSSAAPPAPANNSIASINHLSKHLPLPPTSLGENPIRTYPPRPRTELPPVDDSAAHGVQYSTPPSPPSNYQTLDADGVDGPNDPKRSRACETCRGLKVKCEPDSNHLEGPCKRCAKAKRECVVTVPSRKRQKKTDSRVAELEKKIDALTASLRATQSGASPQESESDQSLSRAGEAESPPAKRARTATERQSIADMAPSATSSLRDDADPYSVVTPASERRPGRTSRTQSQQEMAAEAPCVAAGRKRRHSEDKGDGRAILSPPVTSNGTVTGTPSPADRAARGSSPSHAAYPFLIPRSKTTGGRSSETPTSNINSGPPLSEYADVIDRRILTASTATSLFDRYNTEMAPLFPAVIFSEGTTAAEIRKTKPFLFLSVLVVSSGARDPELQRILNKEFMKTLAEKVIVSGEKSLELVQALLVAVTWYIPPEHYEELKFYQLTHIAAVMAMDLGLGRNTKNMNMNMNANMNAKVKTKLPHATFFQAAHPWRKQPTVDPDSIESKRTWIVIYFLCSNCAMHLRRKNLVRQSTFINECVEELSTSPDAASSDPYMCQWIRIQMIADQVADQFSMDDPSAVIGIADKRTQLAIRGFERQFETWRKNLPKEHESAPLILNGHICNLYIHEVSMHIDHNVDEFKLPFTEATIKSERDRSGSLTADHINALTTTLTACHAVVETFISLDLNTIRNLPISNFVRVSYSLVVLIKMYFSATAPESEFGKVMKQEDIKVEYYLHKLQDTFRAAVEGDRCRPASKFLMVLIMMKTWFRQSEKGGAKALANATFCGDLPVPWPHHGLKSSLKSFDRGRATSATPSAYANGASELARTSSPASTAASIQADRQPEISSANTPLQMLSEVAMGSSNGLPQDLSSSPSGGLSNSRGPSSSIASGINGVPSSGAWYGNSYPQQAADGSSMMSSTTSMGPPQTNGINAGDGGVPNNAASGFPPYNNDLGNFSFMNMDNMGFGENFGQTMDMLSDTGELSSFMNGMLFSMPIEDMSTSMLGSYY